jgi:hypothetical protein
VSHLLRWASFVKGMITGCSGDTEAFGAHVNNPGLHFEE